jgi:hypothetical protein
MSQSSSQKKARRQKRQAKRVAWDTFLAVMDELDDASTVMPARGIDDVILGIGEEAGDTDEFRDLLAQARSFDDRMTQRGWTFDAQHSIYGLAVWHFAPSAFEPDDDDVEAVTRVFFTTGGPLEDNEDFPRSVSLILVGNDLGDKTLQLPVDRFFDKIDAIESYRAGQPGAG